MTIRDTEIESALRSAVCRRVGADDFALWLAHGDAIALDGQTLRIAASNQFKLDRIRTQLRPALEAACEEVLGRVLPLVFVVQEIKTLADISPENVVELAKKVEQAASFGQVDNSSNGSGLIYAGASRGLRRTGSTGGAVETGKPGSSPHIGRKFASLRTFIAGESSCVAFKSCEMVVEKPGEMNPLFLHGPPGTGKTHLLEGVWSAVRQRKVKHVLYLSAEQFTSFFLEALKGGTGLPNFRHKYRSADVLILDDVQFFAGKKATITELQHTVDDMLRHGRQLVLAADRAPGNLQELGPSLMARFSSGMVCGLQRADRATRLAIARQLATIRRLEVPRDVLEYMADNLPGDARQIAGALHRLAASSQAFGRAIDLTLARESLADLIRASRSPLQLHDIERGVCEVLGLETSKLQSPQKTKAVAHPRMLAMYLARKHTRAGLSEIGAHFGRRSHTTVVSAEKAVNCWLAEHSAMHIEGRTWLVEDAIRQIEGRLRVG